jgi:hypothetical protein
MKDIVLTLVFSIVLLLIMFYPAIKIVELIEKRRTLSQKTYMRLTLFITLILSLIAGAALSFI